MMIWEQNLHYWAFSFISFENMEVFLVINNMRVLLVNKTKTKNFADFQNFQKKNFDGGKFLKIWSSLNLPWGHARSHKKVGPIGSAVLTFIRYKHTDKLNLYIQNFCPTDNFLSKKLIYFPLKNIHFPKFSDLNIYISNIWGKKLF